MNQTDSIRGLKVSEKAILDHLARTANDETGLAWLKHETLADRLNCCLQTVRKGIKRLEELKHISRLQRQAKVTLYLVHPGDSLHMRPQLDWHVFAAHLKRSHFPFSFYPNIAGWLTFKGVLAEEEANEILAKYHEVKARKKQRPDSPETFDQAQRHWAYTLKKLGLDAKMSVAEPPLVGEEYEENTIENIKSIGTAGEPRLPEAPHADENEAFKVERCPHVATPSVTDRTASMSVEELARVQYILNGVNRPDRATFVSGQPETSDEPE